MRTFTCISFILFILIVTMNVTVLGEACQEVKAHTPCACVATSTARLGTARFFDDSTSSDSLSRDSNDQDTISETDSTEVEEDTIPEPPKKYWKAQAKAVFSSEKQRDGVELSGSSATTDFSFKLSHDIGAFASFTGTQRLGKNAVYQQSTFTVGYDYEAADWCDLSADLSVYKYPNDSVNVLATSPSSLSFASDFYTKPLDISLSLDHYFGTSPANYLSLSMSHDFAIDSSEAMTISPGLSIAYSSSKFRYKTKLKSGTKTIRGLSGISLDAYFNYVMGRGFSIAADPTLLISYSRDLLEVLKGNKAATTQSTQFVFVLSLRYAFSF